MLQMMELWLRKLQSVTRFPRFGLEWKLNPSLEVPQRTLPYSGSTEGAAHIYIQAHPAGSSLQSQPMPHMVTSRQQPHCIYASTAVKQNQ